MRKLDILDSCALKYVITFFTMYSWLKKHGIKINNCFKFWEGKACMLQFKTTL